jgi:hypothetical protein
MKNSPEGVHFLWYKYTAVLFSFINYRLTLLTRDKRGNNPFHYCIHFPDRWPMKVSPPKEKSGKIWINLDSLISYGLLP